MKKINSFLVVLLLMLASFTAGTQYPRGDANLDGAVNISDVTCLINYLLNGTWGDEPVTPPEEHEWVDLGLPSGIEWATCNIGATNPEDYGYYFAWGETEPKEVYDWSTYKWWNSSEDSFTKYWDYNTHIGPIELYWEDDAADANWGDPWTTPSVEHLQELIDECDWSDTTLNGVEGWLVTGPNGNSMFLPAAGVRWGGSLNEAGSGCYYWSRTLTSDEPSIAYSLGSETEVIGFERCAGLPVRAVRLY
jgi:hypothetical protein